MDFFLLWVLPAFLVGGIGLILLLGTIKNIQRCKAVANWMKTRAVIERALIEKHQRRRNIIGTHQGYSRAYFSPKIEYSYNVMGSPFRSNRYQNFAGTYHNQSEEEAARIVAAYPVGKEVTIAYDPNNPADAYLLPETSTARLEKMRNGQIAMLAVALIWLGVGSVLNLSLSLGDKAADKRIQESAGFLPGTIATIAENLDPLVEKYQLVCQDEGSSGQIFAYHVWACRAALGSELTSIEILNRKEDLEKVDMLSAIYTPSDQGETVTFFSESVSLVFEEADLESAKTWIAESVATIIAGEIETVDTVIGGIALSLDDLGGTIRLNIGDLQ